VQRRGGRLARYRETVEGDQLTGAQVVQLVAERMSVGPRVLLTLLELEGGWVTSSAPGQVLSLVNANPFDSSGLYTQLFMAGSYINAGYYGKLSAQMQVMDLPDGNGVRLPGGINAGTAAVQNLLAHHTTYANWLRLVAPDGFRQTYQKLFGDPAQYALQPSPPADAVQPPLRLRVDRRAVSISAASLPGKATKPPTLTARSNDHFTSAAVTSPARALAGMPMIPMTLFFPSRAGSDQT